jgi:hypothetical protein
MTEKTDELARNAARNAVRDLLADEDCSRVMPDGDGAERVADWVMSGFTVTWERNVNEHGQPVRRYVLRGAWEVDPEAVRP